jgi:hypothetical protein
MVIRTCKDCKKEFEAKSSYNSRFPKRYCDKCSKERRESYADIHNLKASDCEEE